MKAANYQIVWGAQKFRCLLSFADGRRHRSTHEAGLGLSQMENLNKNKAIIAMI